jgi:hypothetical protein
MTEEEQLKAKREYDRKAKREQRSRERAKAVAAIVPKANKYILPEAQRMKLEKQLAQVMSAIQNELKELTPQDVFIIEQVSDVVVGIEQGFSQAVHEPEGILIGGHFPDAVASEAIEHTHRFPQVFESKAFSDLYRKFISAVAKWSKKNSQFVAPEFASDICRELDGSYKLPEKIKPAPPLPEPQAPQPSIEQMGTKLSEQLAGDYSQFIGSGHSDMAPEARKYLDGN